MAPRKSSLRAVLRAKDVDVCVRRHVPSSFCVVEDAIEELLKISASDSEPTVGQGVGYAPSQQTTSHANTQSWSQHLYGQTGSYLGPSRSEGTAPPPYSATPGSQYSYGYNQTYSDGFSEEQGWTGYGGYHSGGNSAYGYGGQGAWIPEVPSVRQETAVGSSVLETPSSSGGSSLSSSPLHAPQGPAVNYSRALHTSPKKGSPSSPRMKPSPLNQTSKLMCIVLQRIVCLYLKATNFDRCTNVSI